MRTPDLRKNKWIIVLIATLRSPGNDFYGAVGVSGGGNIGDYDGYVYSSETGVADDAGTVRPALMQYNL